MLHRLIFDTTDSNTIAESANVGAYLRSGETGQLISYSSVVPHNKPSVTFVDGDVTVGTDNIAITGHGLVEGDLIQLTTSGTLPAGLALATDYYVIRVDADNIKLAASLADAEAGTAVDITAAAGGGTHSVDSQDNPRESLDVRVTRTSLEYAEDSAHTSGDLGSMSLAVRNDSEGSLVDADGDYAPLQVDSSGRLRVVADLDVANLSEKNEDDAHSSGDTGDYVLAVRADTRPTNANVSADGDYSSFFVSNDGELYVKDFDVLAQLVTIDGVLDNILLDTTAILADTDTIQGGYKAEDSAHVSGDTGIHNLAVRQDALASSTSADGDYGSIKQNAKGELYVIDTDGNALLTTIDADTGSIDSTLTALSKTEDAAHSSGDQGIMGLAVRNDTLASLVDTDGDYAPLQVDANGALYVTGSDDNALANTAIASAANALGVADTAEDLVASPLANRKYLFAYNNGNRIAYVGASGVSAANGFPIPPGSMLEMRAGASIDIEWVSSNTAQEMRTLELS